MKQLSTNFTRPLKHRAVKSSIALGALFVCSGAIGGCSSSKSAESIEETLRAHRVSLRQVAPQPVYSRVRFVHEPSPLPSREIPESNAGMISPMVQLDLKNATLEEASSVLAAVSRYSSYTASSIASQRISLSMLGTVDEIATRIAAEAGIKVVVDHRVRQVRFLTGTVATDSLDESAIGAPAQPQFLDEGSSEISR
jgi:hypothetical protein